MGRSPDSEESGVGTSQDGDRVCATRGLGLEILILDQSYLGPTWRNSIGAPLWTMKATLIPGEGLFGAMRIS